MTRVPIIYHGPRINKRRRLQFPVAAVLRPMRNGVDDFDAIFQFGCGEAFHAGANTIYTCIPGCRAQNVEAARGKTTVSLRREQILQLPLVDEAASPDLLGDEASRPQELSQLLW